jgi:hypothetical protein
MSGERPITETADTLVYHQSAHEQQTGTGAYRTLNKGG